MSEVPLRFFHSNRGSITIEFSMVFILFLFILLLSAEISRLCYISASLDFAVSEAAKSAKNKDPSNNSSSASVLQQKLAAHHGILGPFITEGNKVNINIAFSENISDIINNNTSNNDTLSLARYSFRYLYRPFFFPISPYWANTLLLREVIFAQEN
ncbi:TadE/TadG family type IV pilus assembly protein [Yersinia sp. LJYL362]|uniref:TadE/TadG family type IV pilus assembly protein n=1 Tax=Yersinia sp. LJYL362 TaxID=3402108 RepID=UPI003AB17FF5